MDLQDVLAEMGSMADPECAEGMARYGITTENALGISIPRLRSLAKRIGKDHRLAEELWGTGIHEARTLASMIDDVKMLSVEQMERWADDFNSWDICDQCCNNLFAHHPMATEKAEVWSLREEEYVKRAGFVLMAVLAVHGKDIPDERFVQFLERCRDESEDDRNFVKKAVNWAIRQIGKRSSFLRERAIIIAEDIKKRSDRSSKWIATDALRELNSDAVIERLRKKEKKVH